ncbi:uncharacterized protein LOC128514797 isoform X5 [Clarias gariepinus]|uniref:uncharacterized protein LOC128514797 isoform X5 n=1 Tax=Clarias gariepinus TaxID=13013 RepID=UPI00234DB266|nr:uncharacterized protein LOC128514797 isoform X5 [Clarias gariepinus]
MQSAEVELSLHTPVLLQLGEDVSTETRSGPDGGGSDCEEHTDAVDHQKRIKMEEINEEGFLCQSTWQVTARPEGQGTVGDVTPGDEQKPVVKEEPEDEDYLCEGTSSHGGEGKEEFQIMVVKEEESEGSVCTTTVCENRKGLQENEAEAKARREKTRLKVQAWRKRQRENGEKHNDIKKVNRERKKMSRLQLQQQARSDPKLLEALRKKKSEEMKQYRQRKKLKGDTQRADVSAYLRDEEPNTSKADDILKKKKAAWRMRIQMSEPTTRQSTTEEETQSGGGVPWETASRHSEKVKPVLPQIPILFNTDY